MPFVNFPFQCTTCRGVGTIKPVSAFNIHSKFMSVECPLCRGKGTMDNKVFVNPAKVETIPDAIVNHDLSDLMTDIGEAEVEKASKALKKIKSKKSELNDAVG